MIRILFLSLLLPFSVLAQVPNDSLLDIDLQYKNLKTLPNDIELHKIGGLSLGYNVFNEIPSELIIAKNMHELSMDGTKNLNLEASLQTLKKLHIQSLSLNNCKLMYIPIEFGEIKTLEQLYLKNNFIKSIPEYIFIHGDFSVLDLEGNQVAKLPKEIKSQQKLQFIDLSDNACINESNSFLLLKNLSILKELIIKGANVLPASIWDITSLQKLDMSDGIFTTAITHTTTIKHNIQTITATNCNNLDFKTLQPILKSNSIKELSLGGTNFTGFENTTLSTSITKLSLSGDNLNHFSLANKLSHADELVLNFKNINCKDELLKTISEWNNLTSLNLSNCQLTEIPKSIIALKKLKALNLSENKLQSIDELLVLKQLDVLDVSLCELSMLQIETLKKALPNTTLLYNQSYEKLPLVNVTPSSESFVVSPANPQEIVTQNGTKIIIPKNSLVYANGKPVKENVTINFTPYYNLAEIATSGINMNYETENTSAPFSSAGMFNINANAKDEPVGLKQGNEIKVEFKSNDPTESYNYYQYDSVKRRWKEFGKDSIKTFRVAKEKDTVNVIKNAIASTSNSLVPQPQIYYNNHPIHIHWNINSNGKSKKLNGNFSISAKSTKLKLAKDTALRGNYFYEISDLKKVQWQLVSSSPKKNIKTFSANNSLMDYREEQRRGIFKKPRYINSTIRKDKYIEFDIIPDKETDDFVFRFYDVMDTVEFHAYPIINGKNTDRVQKAIKKLYFSFATKSAERKEITKYRKKKFEDAYKRFQLANSNVRNILFNNEVKSIDELLNEKVKNNLTDVTRVLMLRGFGTFNCDRPIEYVNPIVFIGNFINSQNGKKLYSKNIQFIDPRLNISQTFYNSTNLRVSQNSMISVLLTGSNNEIYVGKLNTFNFQKKGNNVTVDLTRLPNNASIKELNDFINLN